MIILFASHLCIIHLGNSHPDYLCGSYKMNYLIALVLLAIGYLAVMPFGLT